MSNTSNVSHININLLNRSYSFENYNLVKTVNIMKYHWHLLLNFSTLIGNEIFNYFPTNVWRLDWLFGMKPSANLFLKEVKMLKGGLMT